MKNNISADAVIAAARSWLGTRFKHQGRVKKNLIHGGGCDCIGLLVGVAAELELKPLGKTVSEIDRCDYARVPSEGRLEKTLELYLQESGDLDPEAGMVALFTLGGEPQHVGIITQRSDGLGLIHAYAQARMVVEHRLDELWQSRLRKLYRFK